MPRTTAHDRSGADGSHPFDRTLETTQSNRNSALSQQYVIQAQGTTENGLATLGTRKELAEKLSRFNTSSDGSDLDALHGPGIRIDFPPASDENEPINQILLSVNEVEIGWLVIERLAKEFRWTIVDAASGRTWSP